MPTRIHGTSTKVGLNITKRRHVLSIKRFLFVPRSGPWTFLFDHGADLTTLPLKDSLASRLSYFYTYWKPLVSATYHFEMLPNPPRFHDVEYYVVKDADFANSSQQSLQSH